MSRPAAPSPKRSNGEGSIYFDRTKQRWVGAATVGLDARGRPIRRKVSGATRQVAATRLRDLLDKADTLDLTAKTPTIAQLAEQWWLGYARTNRDPSTLSIRRGRLERHIIRDPRIANLPADRLRAEHVERWLMAKIDAGYDSRYSGQHRDYAPATIADMRGDLSQILNWAIRRRLIAYNPVSLTDVTAARTSTPKRTLTADQAERLIQTCLATERRWGTYVLACLLLGARPGEIAGLRWDDIDYDAGTIRIASAVKRADGGRAIALGETKSRQTRTLEPDPLVFRALRRERRLQVELRLEAGERWASEWDGLVFLSRTGRPPWSSNLRRALRELVAEAEIDVDYLTLYELRHSCASLLDASGVPVGEIVDQLGHSDDRMFFRHYRHRPDPVVRAANGEAWGRIAPRRADGSARRTEQ